MDNFIGIIFCLIDVWNQGELTITGVFIIYGFAGNLFYFIIAFYIAKNNEKIFVSECWRVIGKLKKK